MKYPIIIGQLQEYIKLDILKTQFNFKPLGKWDIDEWDTTYIDISESIYNFDIIIFQESKDNTRLDIKFKTILPKYLKINDTFTLGNYTDSRGKQVWTTVRVDSETRFYCTDEASQLIGIYGIKF